jgi:hypothetical protein
MRHGRITLDHADHRDIGHLVCGDESTELDLMDLGVFRMGENAVMAAEELGVETMPLHRAAVNSRRPGAASRLAAGAHLRSDSRVRLHRGFAKEFERASGLPADRN